MLMVFVCIGIGILWMARVTDAPIFVYGIGGFFTVFALFFMGATMPSSLMFYYEKQVVAKYGRNKEAVVSDAYTEVLDDSVTLYYFDYEFDYKKTRQFGTFYLDDKALAEKLAVGDAVPIKFLAFDPSQSDVRMRSLTGKLTR